MITGLSSKSGKGFVPPTHKTMRILLPLPRVGECCLPQTHKARWCPRKLSGLELPPCKLSLFSKTAIPYLRWAIPGLQGLTDGVSYCPEASGQSHHNPSAMTITRHCSHHVCGAFFRVPHLGSDFSHSSIKMDLFVFIF